MWQEVSGAPSFPVNAAEAETRMQVHDALEASHDEASSPSEDEGAEDDAAAVDAAAPPGAELQIHLFPTYATQEPGGGEWRVQVHGWCARRSLAPRLGRVA